MTYTTGLAFGFGSNIEKAKQAVFYQSIKCLVEKYGYLYTPEIENCEKTIQGGLKDFVNDLEVNALCVVQAYAAAGKDGDCLTYAVDIDEELFQREVYDKRPKFFDFLFELSIMAKAYTNELTFFFADEEWGEGEQVRYDDGYIEDLIIRLRQPASWAIRVQHLSDMARNSYEGIPLVYKVKLVGEGDKEK